jgi:hypothetical protein
MEAVVPDVLLDVDAQLAGRGPGLRAMGEVEMAEPWEAGVAHGRAARDTQPLPNPGWNGRSPQSGPPPGAAVRAAAPVSGRARQCRSGPLSCWSWRGWLSGAQFTPRGRRFDPCIARRVCAGRRSGVPRPPTTRQRLALPVPRPAGRSRRAYLLGSWASGACALTLRRRVNRRYPLAAWRRGGRVSSQLGGARDNVSIPGRASQLPGRQPLGPTSEGALSCCANC